MASPLVAHTGTEWGWPCFVRGSVAKRNGRKRLPLESTALIPQAHGGALRNGAPKGSPGGPGVLPKVVREAFRQSAYNRLPILEAIADDGEKDSDRINAVLGLARVGLGTDESRFTAAQLETPDGFRFSLVLGERRSD